MREALKRLIIYPMNSCKSLVLVALCAILLGAPALALANPWQGASASSGEHRGRWASMFSKLDLTPQQEDQIKSLIEAYRQAHPQGSQPDPAARKQLQEQIFAVLTPDQRAQLEQEEQQWRDDHGGRGQGADPSPSPEP
jgi:Spy/CpxP family protein refolding chaperone